MRHLTSAEVQTVSENLEFIRGFRNIARRVHGTAYEKGWWDNERNDGELIALMHSELSEGLEGLRAGNPPSDKIGDYTAIEEELADVIVRIMDAADARGWKVAEALIAKLAFNAKRERMHGGKKF